jgi:hypothetical protein
LSRTALFPVRVVWPAAVAQSRDPPMLQFPAGHLGTSEPSSVKATVAEGG